MKSYVRRMSVVAELTRTAAVPPTSRHAGRCFASARESAETHVLFGNSTFQGPQVRRRVALLELHPPLSFRLRIEIDIAAIMRTVALLAVAVCGAAARSAVHTPGGVRRATIDRLHGGAAEPSDALLQATFASNALYASTLAEAAAEVSMLRKSVGASEIVPNLGAKADALFSEAADKFASGTPAGEADVMALYKAKAEELRAALSTAVEPVFVSQITLIKDGAPSERALFPTPAQAPVPQQQQQSQAAHLCTSAPRHSRHPHHPHHPRHSRYSRVSQPIRLSVPATSCAQRRSRASSVA